MTLAKKKAKIHPRTEKCMNIEHKTFPHRKWFKWLSLSLKRRRLNPFQLQGPIIIRKPVLNTLFLGRADQSLKEMRKRETFKLQVWKNSALWIVYSIAGEWGNHAIRPGLEGNCQMIYNPHLANFKTQCWTNTSSHKKWCVALGFTLRKRACWLI